MSKQADPTLPYLGLFYGEGGGPGASVPATDAHAICPFLEETKQFCSLDGEMCPFLGFNYRRCKKYIINLSRGVLPKALKGAPVGKGLQADNTPKAAYKKAPGTSGGPRSNRVESLFEAVMEDLEALSEAKNPSTLSTEKDALDVLTDRVDATIKRLNVPKTKIEKDNELWPALMAAVTTSIYKDYKLEPEAQEFLDARRMVRKDIGAYMSAYWKVVVDGGSRQNALRELSKQLQNARDAGGGETDPRYVEMMKAALRGIPDHEDLELDAKGRVKAPLGAKDAASEAMRRLTQAATKAEKKANAAAKEAARKAKAAKKSRTGKKGTTGRGRKKGRGKRGTTNVFDPEFGSTEKQWSKTQFDTWFAENLKRVPPHIKDKMFRDNAQFRSPEDVSDYVAKLAKTNNKVSIKQVATKLQKEVFGDYFEAEHHRQKVIRDWDNNVAIAKKLGMVTDADLKFLRNDPRQLDRTAKKMNAVMRKVIRYDLDMKTLPSGAKIAVPVRKSLIPTFTKKDYEVRRMSEQAGLRAIQMQHRYGKDYGRYNTRNLFFKELVSSFVLLMLGVPELIRPIQSMWPQGWIDARFFANREEIPKLASDDKTALTKRFVNRNKRLMRGFELEAPLPPDKNVLHSRWLPTTKKPWSKMKASVLRQQHLDAEKRPRGNNTWRQSYTPR